MFAGLLNGKSQSDTVFEDIIMVLRQKTALAFQKSLGSLRYRDTAAEKILGLCITGAVRSKLNALWDVLKYLQVQLENALRLQYSSPPSNTLKLHFRHLEGSACTSIFSNYVIA